MLTDKITQHKSEEKLRFSSLLLPAILFFSISCSGSEQETPPSEQRVVTVTDQMGREVTVRGYPQRIVSSYYISSAMLIALEADERIVALEMKAETRPLYRKAAPHLTELPGIGNSKTINVEESLALGTDLVILPYRLESFISHFEEAGVPVIVVMPETLDLFLSSITLLGDAIGTEERAAEFRGYYENRIAGIKRMTETLATRPSVYIAGSQTPLRTVTGRMYQSAMIEIAGGRNVSAELTDGYWTDISPEQLLLWNPDYIFPVQYASYKTADILDDQRFGSLKAVEESRIARFPSPLEPWDYPTPSSLLGILWLTNRLHPDLYPRERYSEAARNFYREFFRIEVTGEEVGLE